MSGKTINGLVVAAVLAMAGGWWLALDRFEAERDAAKADYDAVVAFSYSQQHWPEAAAGFEQVAARWPDSPYAAKAQRELIWARLLLKDDTGALAAAERLAERYRGTEFEPEAWYFQGFCRRRLGQSAAAAENLRWCLEQFPDDSAAVNARQLLAAVEGDLAETRAGAR